MAYQIKTVASGGAFGGPKGGAKVAWNKDRSLVKVVLGDKAYTFKASELPIKTFPPGEYYVQLSEDKKEILAIRPNNGMFNVVVDRFISKEGEEPSPQDRSYEFEGKTISYQAFSVILKILSPKELKGMEILLTLRYHFTPIEDEVNGKKVEVIALNHQKSKYTEFLKEFLSVSGALDAGPIKASTNILPTLAKRIARAEKSFKVVVKDGWVTTFFDNAGFTEETSDDEDDDFGEEPEFEVGDDGKGHENDPDTLQDDEDEELNWE